MDRCLHKLSTDELFEDLVNRKQYKSILVRASGMFEVRSSET
jgi:hypothetical protein